MEQLVNATLKEFYDMESLSAELGVNIQTLRKWIKSGELKASKVGTKYITTRKNVNEFIDRLCAIEVPDMDFLETLKEYEVCQIAMNSNNGIMPDGETFDILIRAIEKAYQLGYRRALDSTKTEQ